MPQQKRKQTLQELHDKVAAQAAMNRKAVLNAIGSSYDSTFYDLLNGNRKNISPAERAAIAAIYNVSEDEIDWKDRKKTIA